MKTKLATKKRRGAFGMDAIPQAVIAIGISVFALALILTFLGNLQDTQTADTFEYNATQEGMEGLAEFNNWWVILVIGVIFLILFAFLATFRRQTAQV